MLNSLSKIKYVPVENCIAEWVDKEGLMKRYENLNVHTLNRWLGEMRDHKKFRDYVINPSHKKVWINLDGFHEFLVWRQKNFGKN